MKIVQTKPLNTIIRAVNNYAEFISPTYGPAGKKTLISLSEYSVRAIDDGHESSKDFELENEFENAVVSYVKEATEKTNNRVGDGTTTAVILTRAIVKEVTKDAQDVFSNKNYHGKVLEIEKATKEAIQQIKDKAKKIKTKQELFHVAYNSYNNKEIATLISDTLFQIGEEGIISIEDSASVNTEIEMVQGLELEKGLLSPYFINTANEQAILHNPRVLIYKKRIESFNTILPIIKNIVEAGKKEICIVAEGFSNDVINNVIMYKLKGIFSPILIEAPGFGDAKQENIENIAAVTGAIIIDSDILRPEDVNPQHLGDAEKITCKKDKTTIIGLAKNQKEVNKRVIKLKARLETASKFEKDTLNKQIASLTGGIALIKVGANTENEQKAIKAKVEDAVNATKVAFKDGIVKGAGMTYIELKTSSSLLNSALLAPRNQLTENGEEYLDSKVTDPAGVLIAALETASSIACGLLTIGGIIAMKREKKEDNIF